MRKPPLPPKPDQSFIRDETAFAFFLLFDLLLILHIGPDDIPFFNGIKSFKDLRRIEISL
jgi:hypothetical protein